MVARIVLFGDEARQSLMRGMQAVAQAVRVTLGPRGRNALLERSGSLPFITSDGVTIARSIVFRDVFENMGVRLLQEVATKTGEAAGDGTTTSIVLTQKMVEEGMKALLSLHNPVWIRNGMEKALGIALEELRKRSIPLDDKRYILGVASISARDSSLGELVALALEKVGREGIVTIEESRAAETTLEVVEGLRFDRGFLSPYFVTERERQEVLLENPLILVSDYKIHNASPILPLLEKVFQAGHPLLLIAGELEGEALTFLVVNKLRGALQVAAVKAPEFGEYQREVLGDIAVLSGGQVILQDLGMKLEKASLELLGQAERVRITKDQTIIIGGKGKKRDIEERVQRIRVQMEKATSDYERERHKKRLANLTRGVAVIRVGAPTEVKLKEKRERLEDALSATRAALEEGIVPGGGTALLHIAEKLRVIPIPREERVGVEIVCRALEEPIRQIAENAGYRGSLVAEEVKRRGGNTGFDALQGTFVDMFEAGIVDPAKVLRIALQNAVSMASLVLTTQAIVAEIPE